MNCPDCTGSRPKGTSSIATSHAPKTLPIQFSWSQNSNFANSHFTHQPAQAAPHLLLQPADFRLKGLDLLLTFTILAILRRAAAQLHTSRPVQQHEVPGTTFGAKSGQQNGAMESAELLKLGSKEKLDRWNMTELEKHPQGIQGWDEVSPACASFDTWSFSGLDKFDFWELHSAPNSGHRLQTWNQAMAKKLPPFDIHLPFLHGDILTNEITAWQCPSVLPLTMLKPVPTTWLH